MKNNVIIGIILLTLTACVSLQFDPLEFDRFVTMKELAQEGYMLCGKPGVDQKADQLTSLVRHQNLYAASRTTRNDIRIATQNLTNIIEGLDRRYDDPNPPSITYCREKFDNISNATSIIMSTMGKL